jgi:hypothetical protein
MATPPTESCSEEIAASLESLRSIDKRLQDVFKHYIRVGSPMYGAHLLLWGAGHRTATQSLGFQQMVEQSNMTCAHALVRLQLDTALRLHAGILFGHLDGFSNKVMAGQKVDKLRDRSGQRLTDRYLARNISQQHPWVERVYVATSGNIHLSARHIHLSLGEWDEAGGFGVRIDADDRALPPELFLEAVEGFYAITALIIEQLVLWFRILERDMPAR